MEQPVVTNGHPCRHLGNVKVVFRMPVRERRHGEHLLAGSIQKRTVTRQSEGKGPLQGSANEFTRNPKQAPAF